MYSDYSSLVDGLLYKGIAKEDESKRTAVAGPGKLVPRGRKRVAYRKLVTGLIFLGVFVAFGGTWHYGVALSDWFAQQGLLHR